MILPKPVFVVIAIGVLTTAVLAACGSNQPGGKVFFIEPRDGAQVGSPFTVKMGVEDLVIEPAQEDGVYLANHGHHHIIVDADLPRLDQPVPSGSVQHLHFGEGQVEATLNLEAGEHTLRLLFAKGDHIAWTPPQSTVIKITVVE